MEQLKASLKYVKKQIKDGKGELTETVKKNKEQTKEKKNTPNKRSIKVLLLMEGVIEPIDLHVFKV